MLLTHNNDLGQISLAQPQGVRGVTLRDVPHSREESWNTYTPRRLMSEGPAMKFGLDFYSVKWLMMVRCLQLCQLSSFGQVISSITCLLVYPGTDLPHLRLTIRMFSFGTDESGWFSIIQHQERPDAPFFIYHL